MRAWFARHRSLLGYLALVVLAVILLEVQTVHTNRDLNRHDERSCAQRNKLAQNQRAVLGGLIAVVTIEVDEIKDHEGTRASLLAVLKDLRSRQPSAGPETC